MQAEEQTDRLKVPPMAEPKVEKEAEKPKTWDERKKEILATPAHKRTKKDKEDLEEMEAVEEAERHRGSLLHRLVETADKYGRRETFNITKEITTRVGLFGKDEVLKIKRVNDSRKGRKDEAHKRAKDEMDRIQRELNAGLRKIDKECDETAGEVRNAFRPQYDEAESEMKERTAQISDLVGHFTQTIQTLDTKQLEVLTKEGVVRIGPRGGKEEYLVRPDSPPETE